jgi:Siphovirus Gp157
VNATKTNLFALTGDQQAFLELWEEVDGELAPEQEAAFDALFADLQTDLAGCVERMLNFRAYLVARASVSKSREESFKKARVRDEKAAERIEQTIFKLGTGNGWLTPTEGKAKGAKIVTDSWAVSVQRNGGVKPMELDNGFPIEQVPEQLTAKVIDKEKVREYLELDADASLPFAKLLDRGLSLRIK